MIYDDHYNKPMDWTLTGTMAQYCAPSCGDGMINQTGEQCDLGTGN